MRLQIIQIAVENQCKRKARGNPLRILNLPFQHNHNSLRVYCASQIFHSHITTIPRESTVHPKSLFVHNHNSLHLARKSDWMPLKCNFLPNRELPRSFASGSLTVAAIKWKQKALGNLKRTILKTEKFILKANGFLKSSEVRPRKRWRRLFGCVNSRVLACWLFSHALSRSNVPRDPATMLLAMHCAHSWTGQIVAVM